LKNTARTYLSLIILLALLCSVGGQPAAAAVTGIPAGNVYVDGKLLNFRIGEADKKLMVPADVIYPALGATCKMNRTAGTLNVKLGLKSFTIRENNYDIMIGDKRVPMEDKPSFSGNHMMVPLRAVVESVGGGVKWDGSRKAWQVYTRDRLESMVDIMGDGTALKKKLSSYEKYFTDDKYVFWSAFRDGAAIYRSDKNGKNGERLLDRAAEIIGLDKDNIYYIDHSENNHLYRIRKDGTKPVKLVAGSVSDASLKGDTIEYYSLENGLAKCSVRTDGSGYKLLQDEITVMDGDWTIQGNQTLQGKNILLKGDLLIGEGASLTLENTRLVFDTGKDTGSLTKRRLEVKNGTFVLKGGTLRSTRQDNGIDFYAEASGIKIQGSRISNIIGNIMLERCSNVEMTDNYVLDSATSGFVNSNNCSGALYTNNVIINKDRGSMSWITFLSGSRATGLIIRDNVCVDQGECLFLQQGSDGLISGNLVLGDQYWLGLSLRHDAGNSTYDNNFLQQNYDDGYQINEVSNTNAVNADSLDSTTTFSRNVVNNSGRAFQMQNMSNCVFDSNRAWMQLFNPQDNRIELAAVSMQYSHHNEILNNTFESWNGASGLQAFYCTENRVENNTFSGFKYGIELWNKSDDNSIRGNRVVDCVSSILTNESQNNKVSGNALVSTKNTRINVYNSGSNQWSSNYYSDQSGMGPRKIDKAGTDSSPLPEQPGMKKVQSVYTARAFDLKRMTDMYELEKSSGRISENELWKDKTVHYDVGHDFKVLKGATLTLENVTFLAPVFYKSEPEIYIEEGASLILKNSRIVADPKGMPFYFRVENGATFIAENCTFENINEFNICGAKSVIRNCTFTDCFEALALGMGDDAKIENCKIVNSFEGIRFYSRSGGKAQISGIKETNITAKFVEPGL
jgi:parallel beta-helix repeat protein